MDIKSFAISMQDFLSTIIDTVLPPRINTRRTKERTLSQIPLTIATHRLLGTDITTIMDYQKSAVRDLIRSLKYDGSGYAAQLCATVLADYLREEIATLRTFSPRPVVIIPLPLHHTRKHERGFNQIELIFNRLPKEFHNGEACTVATNILARTRKTMQQALLTRDMRIKNVRHAFTVNEALSIRDTHIILIDDVTTTGATLASAGETLKKAGATVSLLALARA